MQNEFVYKGGNVNALSYDERAILETKVIPNAVRWMQSYPTGSSLWESGHKTLAFWGRLSPQHENQDDKKMNT